jgi:hypothetical protein
LPFAIQPAPPELVPPPKPLPPAGK